ncbi:hypothetical protein JTB14_007856 [Gonioctena quinquepunctata]|nr:hypothetical protein JTB14_007856 [Gonioctena quinquepunctata]
MENDLPPHNTICECEFCKGKVVENVSNLTLDVSQDKCENWLMKCPSHDTDNCSVFSESSDFTETTDNSAMDSGFVFENNEVVMSDRVLSERNETQNLQLVVKNESPKYDNINIYKSRKVHIGDVTYINGPIFVNTPDKDKINSYDDDIDSCMVVTRTNWLAQPPLGEKEFLENPARYVVIGHTATEEGFTQAENTLLIRLIQTFHIESKKWKDTAYNFLIGSDGLAYEGRGWGVIGSHTRGYNSQSMGISFIGCFLDHLPPSAALKKTKELIAYGVSRGSIAEDYVLLAHCQCSAVESPGRRLFEEIQTWDHWDGSVPAVVPTLSGMRFSESSDGENMT